MSKDKKHINHNSDFEDKSIDLFSNLKIPYDKSKEDIWKIMESKLEEKTAIKTGIIQMKWVRIAAAAIFILLIGIPLFMRFYSETVICNEGEHISLTLPDGSFVQMNAKSKLSYNPLWWKYSRSLEFDGEAFFEVKKGNKFEVISDNGKTMVLGTSFNVYSRKNNYEVTCLTGRVKVTAVETNSQVILNPNEKATLDQHGIINIEVNINTENSVLWISNKFIFTSAPLIEVIDEISRQYGVNITYSVTGYYLYSGYFTRNRPVEEVLDLVCKSFGIKFVKHSNGDYQVIN